MHTSHAHRLYRHGHTHLGLLHLVRLLSPKAGAWAACLGLQHMFRDPHVLKLFPHPWQHLPLVDGAFNRGFLKPP